MKEIPKLIPWKKNWTHILLLFLFLRLVYSGIGLIVALDPNLRSNPVDGPSPAADTLLFSDPFSIRFINVWERWDTNWYLKIAAFGYDAEDGSIVYAPLFPLLVRFLGLLTGNYLASALILASLFSLLVFILLYEVSLFHRADAEQAFYSVLFLAFFPSAFFLFAAYTESLFLALVLSAILSAHKKYWLLAGILASLATLARHQGVLLVPVLVWMFLDSGLRNVFQEQSFGKLNVIHQMFHRAGRKRTAQVLKNWRWAYTLLPVIVYSIYYFFINLNYGSMSVALKTHFGITAVAPWTGFIQFLQRLFTTPRIAMDYFDLGFLVLSIFVLFLNLQRINPAYLIYSFLILTSLFMRGTTPDLLDSFLRYLLMVFPVFLAFGFLNQKIVRIILLTAFFELQLFFLFAFLHKSWVA